MKPKKEEEEDDTGDRRVMGCSAASQMMDWITNKRLMSTEERDKIDIS
jgi:hypothetical protein